MSERSIWDDLKPTWRDAIVLTLGFAGGMILPSKIKQYMDKRDIEQAERIANYLKEHHSNPAVNADLSQLYQAIENLTRRVTELEKREYR
ncbi:MAG: hypothetical protein QXO57_03425 [Candidatus Aenigmatarchaeota archaeon]